MTSIQKIRKRIPKLLEQQKGGADGEEESGKGKLGSKAKRIAD